MKIAILVDNPRSWFVPFAVRLRERLVAFGEVDCWSGVEQIQNGTEITFLLSCEKKVPREILARSRHNIVVHASDLPQGRGMSPLTWQVLEGQSLIPITLFEADIAIDAGPYYIKDSIQLAGNELLDEMQAMMGTRILAMCELFVARYPGIIAEAKPQVGTPTFYRRRRPVDSQLDPNKSIAEQFNLLRVVDNTQYPAFFEWKGRKFVLNITPSS